MERFKSQIGASHSKEPQRMKLSFKTNYLVNQALHRFSTKILKEKFLNRRQKVNKPNKENKILIKSSLTLIKSNKTKKITKSSTKMLTPTMANQ